MSLCNTFPEGSKLFQQLAEEEARHADILTISAGFNKLDELPNRIVPDSMEPIEKSLQIAQDLSNKIHDTSISLKTALEMSLNLERALAENYFNEIMSKESGYEIISYLQQFYKDEMSHADRIIEYMIDRGYSNQVTVDDNKRQE